MASEDESEYEPMYTEMLEDICDINQSQSIINRRDASYKMYDCITQR